MKQHIIRESCDCKRCLRYFKEKYKKSFYDLSEYSFYVKKNFSTIDADNERDIKKIRDRFFKN